MEVVNWLANVEKLKNDCTEAASEDYLPPHQQVDILMHEVEDFMRQGKGPFEARETKVNKLLEDKMVGEAFQRNTTKILEYLVGNQISRIGIYGMGCVGKTTIMVHIHNRLLEEANHGNVLWITVSQDFNTQSLQDAIGKELCLDILQENDVRKRASMLCNCLTKRGKSILILDDVWECFDLKEVGIPIKADGIKLVLTTRSFEVCRQMQCQEMIKIEPLSHKEAESLFLEELKSKVALNLETKAIVKSIVKECAGLPLAIVTMAKSMRGVTNVFEWKDCLKKLRDLDMGQTDMEKMVLKKLEFSYNRLGKLTSLRKLDVFYCVQLEAIKGLEKLAVNEEDIIKLCALEALECQFEDVDDFNKLVRVVSQQRNKPRYYKLVCEKQSEINVELIQQAPFQNCERSVRIGIRSHCIVSAGGESSGHGICILIPQHVRTLSVGNCDGATNLSDMDLPKNLEELTIDKWKNLHVLNGRQDEEIINIDDSPTPTPAPLLFLSLRVLSIYDCPRLKYLFGHGPEFYLPHLREIRTTECKEMVGITVAVTSPSPHPSPAFPGLEDIIISKCDKMKRVVESEWLPHFPNLR
ncbi:probable disease resistance protein At5g43740 [Eucalyptus grandis]|uniref:probable disease resistance protein At5g43740 n=1 Tax=Eucalyptus grandis TaxID=71139 RepID=UPI00192E9C50|nr:probable disease resistance protein At5g43740 [Eucalyptus grandis]